MATITRTSEGTVWLYVCRAALVAGETGQKNFLRVGENRSAKEKELGFTDIFRWKVEG